MARRPRDDTPGSGWEYVIAGAILGLLGTAILLDSDGAARYLGAVLAWLGGILTLLGAVGIGVTIGMRRADYLIRGKPR